MKGTKKIMSLVLAVMAMATLVISIFLPWASVDGRMELDVMAIQAGVDIDVDFYPHQFTYDVTANTSGGGLLGGGDTNISDRRYYTEGLEGFGAIGGMLYRAPNPAKYKIQVLPPMGGRADIWVTLNREAPLWWPAGLEETFSLDIVLENITGVKEIRIKSAKFFIYTDYNETKAASNMVDRHVPFDKRQVHSERSLSGALSSTGDVVSHRESVIVRDYHERFGIGVDVTYEAETDNGQIITTGTSYTGQYPPAAHQIQITQTQAAKVVMLGVAFPLMLATLVVGAIAIALSLKDHSHTRYLLLAACALSSMCSVFFWMGTGVFLELMDIVEPWFSYNIFLLLPLASGALFFVGFLVERVVEREDLVEFIPEEDAIAEDDKHIS